VLTEPDRSRRAFAIQQWLVSQIAELIEVRPSEIDVTKPFQYYGLNSAEAAMLSVDLENWLRITVTPTLAWDYPTIEAAAGYLADQAPAEQSKQSEQTSKDPKT
jgi:acyl carrier protein